MLCSGFLTGTQYVRECGIIERFHALMIDMANAIVNLNEQLVSERAKNAPEE
jgi:hypothetical protein